MSDKPNPQISVTGFWLAGLGMIVGLAVLSLVLSWIPGAVLSGLPLIARVVIAILLIAVPAMLWLVIFMRQDRLEPEPRGYVFGLYVFSIILKLCNEKVLIISFISNFFLQFINYEIITNFKCFG